MPVLLFLLHPPCTCVPIVQEISLSLAVKAPTWPVCDNRHKEEVQEMGCQDFNSSGMSDQDHILFETQGGHEAFEFNPGVQPVTILSDSAGGEADDRW